MEKVHDAPGAQEADLVSLSRQPRNTLLPAPARGRLAKRLPWLVPVLGFAFPTMGLGLSVAALGGAFLCAASSAHAEEPDASGGLEAKVREQMEKIRRLMRENERALFLLSTGSDASPQRVEVEIPPGSGSGDGAGATGSGGQDGGNSSGNRGAGEGGRAGGSQGDAGEAARKELEEALRRLSSDGAAIPIEIERLVQMIPLTEGGEGSPSGPPQPNDGKSGEMPDAKSRDERRSPAEREAAERAERDKQRREQGEKPESGGRSDKDPPPGSTGQDNDPSGPQRPDDGAQDWRASLPAELRDAAAGGRWEQIPERYRALIERYWRWIEERRRSGR